MTMWRWLAALSLVASSLAVATRAAATEPVFLLGAVDGSPKEFGRVGANGDGSPVIAWRDDKPVVFRVGKSDLAEFPREQTASRPDGTRIEFRLDRVRPLTLHVGVLCAEWNMYAAKELRLALSVNGQPPIENKIAAMGESLTVSLPVKAEWLTAGDNHLTLHVRGGRILYDYLLLGDSGEAPANPALQNLLADALAGPLANVEELVFTTRNFSIDNHYYANIGRHFGKQADGSRSRIWGAGGRLMKLKLRTGETTALIEDLEGSIRDPQVHYDGKRIIFSWLKGGTEHFNLYEINTDGTGLRRLTDNPYDDIEPTYLASGDIVFSSSRANRAVNCWLYPVATLYRSDGNGRNIRPLSPNLEFDNTPWPLPDGRILFTRWEYNDRSQFAYHHLWSARPDGSGVAAYFGNMHGGHVYIDAKPIPSEDDVVLTISHGHGDRDHHGTIAVFSPEFGPDALGALEHVGLSYGSVYRRPYPLSRDFFLVTTVHWSDASPSRIMLLSRRGATVPIYELPKQLANRNIQEVVPIAPRPREPIIPDQAVPGLTTGRFLLANAHVGRNMTGVKPGEIKKLLVLEALPKPVNFFGWQAPISYGGIFNMVRILGEVPVEPDGSAYFEAPAGRMLFFVSLDENDLSVKRMQSLVSLMPGETAGCVGCHEQRTYAPAAVNSQPLAIRRPPSPITPIQGVPEITDFPRDIQPILDRHCIACHQPDQPGGNVVLTSDQSAVFTHSYLELSVRTQIGSAGNGEGNRPPRSVGSAAAALLKKTAGNHHDVRVTPAERTMLRLWIEAGAPFPGTYAALGSGMVLDWPPGNQIATADREWPEVVAAKAAIERRCVACHNPDKKNDLASRLSSYTPPDISDQPVHNPREPRFRYGRHRLYNLSRPEKARLLLTPLAKAGGGYAGDPQGPHGLDHPVVFADTGDADYRVLLAAMERYKAELDRRKRFNMPGFQPRDEYLETMARYGILPPREKLTGPVDSYAVDAAYFRSFWPKNWNYARE